MSAGLPCRRARAPASDAPTRRSRTEDAPPAPSGSPRCHAPASTPTSRMARRMCSDPGRRGGRAGRRPGVKTRCDSAAGRYARRDRPGRRNGAVTRRPRAMRPRGALGNRRAFVGHAVTRRPRAPGERRAAWRRGHRPPPARAPARHDPRIRDAGARRRRPVASVAEIGQQVPVIVIAEADRPVLIDGYLRVEALRRLGRDRRARSPGRSRARGAAAVSPPREHGAHRDRGCAAARAGCARTGCRSRSWRAGCVARRAGCRGDSRCSRSWRPWCRPACAPGSCRRTRR